MSDWLDSLADEVREGKQKKEAERVDAQRRESRFREASQLAFEEMDRASQNLSHMVNARLYDQRRELEHRYIDNTITGDQFLLQLRNFTMAIRMDMVNGKVTYKTQSYFVSRKQLAMGQRGTYTPVEAASGELIFERDSDYGILRTGESVYSPEEAAQYLVGVLVKAAEGVLSD